MRVGILGTTLRRPLTGVGRYTDALIRSLRATFPENEYWVVRSPWDNYVDPGPPSLTASPGDRWYSRFKKARWAMVTAPRRACSAPFDVVHSPGPISAFTFTPRSGPRKVVTVHDVSPLAMPDTHRWQLRVEYRWLAGRSLAACDGVIVDSSATRSELLRFFPECQRKPIQRIPLGVDPLFFDAAPQVAQRPYFLSVGSLEPRKNLVRIVQAFRDYVREGGQNDLVLLGPGGWRNRSIRAELADPGLKGRVRSLGYVSDEVLASWYAGASGLVYPTLYEGFGLPILEAMAANCPVLTSDVSSLPEVAGDCALLVGPTDLAAITAGMLRLDSASVRADLARRGRQRADLFTWEETARRTQAAYESALGP